MKLVASCQLCSLKNCSENFWEIPRQPFTTEHILTSPNYAAYVFCC